LISFSRSIKGKTENMTAIFFWKYRWLFFLLLLFPWFFIGGPGYEGSRLLKEAWNLGHIMFFAAFALETYRYLAARRLANRTKYIFTMLLIFALATSIEACQSLLSGRVTSIKDIIFGLAGGLVILVWKDSDQQSLNRKIFWRTLGSSGIAMCMIPLSIVVVDEYRAWRDFPVLSDFESFLDVSRWEAKNQITRVREPVKNGRFSLKVQLNTNKYSGIALKHFPHNWSGAKALEFSVFNPGETVALSYRVHDWKHRGKNQAYHERFNGKVNLTSGWNTIAISMVEIVNGPKNRKMELEDIRGVGFFVVEQPVEKVIYIDNVKLRMNNSANSVGAGIMF